MTIETKPNLGSKCRCQNFSCEPAFKNVDDVNVFDPSRRFRFIKNNEGAICDGGFVNGGVDSCQIRIDKKNGITKPANIPVARIKNVESLVEYKNNRIAEIDSKKDKVKTKGDHTPSLNIIDFNLKAKLSKNKKKKLTRSENNYHNIHHRYSLIHI